MRFRNLFAFIFLFASTHVFAQCPPNIGFEDGGFGGWTASYGRIRSDGSRNITGTVVNPTYHQIISESTAGLDRYGRFPTLCPNGSKYSVKLGDDYPGTAESLAYVYDVPAGKATTLKLNYALVLGNPAVHTNAQQARFTLKLFDVATNAQIPCPAFDFIARTGAGFKEAPISSSPGGDSFFYKDWSSVIIDLDGHQGKKIRFEFTTSDCTEGLHSGYAYFDIDQTCGNIEQISGDVFCQGQTNIKLNGPGGYDSYTWYKGTNINQPGIGTGQSLVIAAPVDQDIYTLVMGSIYGLCPNTLQVTLSRRPTPFVMDIKPILYGCPGSSVDLHAAINTTGPTYTFHSSDATLDYLPSPQAITKPGIYYIKGTLPEGCTDIQAVEVKFLDAPAIVVTPPAVVDYPATIDISTVHNTLPGVTYTYYRNSNASDEVNKIITTSGRYYIKGVYNATCPATIVPVQITITPPPYAITAPNTFTPNNDGINDEFELVIGGYIKFNRLDIYNRYGTPVFTAKSIGEYWKGNSGNKQVPVGTYYWIFEGIDVYYKTPIRKTGWVTIIR